MSKYSFLLASKEAEYFELVPNIRLRKHGGWLVAEAIEQEEISKAQSQATIRAVQLAKKISTAKGISIDEAFALLQGGGDFSEMDLLGEFTEETLGMINSAGSAESGNARIVTAFIRCRGEGLVEGEWEPLEDWSMEDTKKMDRPTIARAVEFVMSEQEAESQGANTAKKSPRRTKEVTQSD